MKRKIILDTDIGDDIDDAFALAFAAAHEEIELVGVTTVFRNAALRAKMAKALLAAAGAEGVPVCAGEDDAVAEPVHGREDDVYGADGKFVFCQYDGAAFGRFSPDAEGAVQFIVRQANEHPGEITLVGIGPLTNIARALEADTGLKHKLAGILIMGGWFTNETPEWNILCDPEAAQTVFASGIVTAVGLDVTLRCGVDAAFLQKLQGSGRPVCRLISAAMRRWFDCYKFEKSVLHDPLTVCSLVSDCLAFEREEAEVTLTGTRGITRPCKGGAPVLVAKDVDREKFFAVLERNLF